jgi:outer membrane receptor protein involved in Fe transport
MMGGGIFRLIWLVTCLLILIPHSGWTAPPQEEMSASDLSQLSIEQLSEVKISTVSRVSESIDEAPGSVYVYSRDVIQKRGFRTLRELLQVVPGFTVFHKDLQYVAGVRGLNANDNEKITLLVNGQEVNQINEPEFLNGPINLDNVERVEVVVGPSSFFQQANTLAATVNVITWDVEDKDFQEVIAAFGSDLPYSTTLMAGKRWSENRFLNFSFTTERKTGFDAWNADFRPNLAMRKVTGELDGPSYFSVLKGQLDEWSGQFVAYRANIPELLIDSGDPSNSGELTDQFYTLFAKNEHPWTSGFKSILRLAATLKEQTRENRGGPPINGLQQSTKARVYNSELGFEYTGYNKHLIQVGLQGTYEQYFDSWYTLHQTEPPLVIPKTTLFDGNTYAIGFYVDDVLKVTDNLKLIGGVRIDENTRLREGRWFPGGRAAVILKPTPKWFSKLIYNRAVRMPSPLAALNQAWGMNNPNPPSFANFSPTATEPETLSTVEFQNIFYFGTTRFGTTIYHQDLKDFISWLSPHTNVGNFQGDGVELNVETRTRPSLTLWANASYNDSVLNARIPPVEQISTEQHHVEVNNDQNIIGAPKYVANAGADIEIASGLFLSPQVRYFTDQAAYNNSAQKFETINDRFYLDSALNWKSRKWIQSADTDFRFSLTNILNNRDQIAGQWLRDTYRPQGIEAVITLDIRF